MVEDSDKVIVNCGNGTVVVIMSLEEYESIRETNNPYDATCIVALMDTKNLYLRCLNLFSYSVSVF